MSERRTLKMHPRLLWDVIHRQAGSIGKAILEGVMNSVDAGATYCDVTIDRESFSVSDDGKGFASDEEINKFFETFGYPHEEGDAKYGRFRMGRGQMMAFGKNAWRTNEYTMLVDLKPQKNELGEDYALGYEFSRSKEKHKGCSVHVDLYEKLTPSVIDSTEREIADYVKYVDIPVRLNGKLISGDPKLESWDDETPDAYIKHKASGTLDVYNQGVLVSKLSSYRYGASGVVVSKKALEVNFARNDVQSSCPIWKRIVKKLKDDSLDSAKRSAPLTESQRDFYVRSLANGEISLEAIKESRVVTDVTGSHHPFSVLTRLANYGGRLSIAQKGDMVGERAHTRKMAFVMTDECAARFGTDDPAELVRIIKAIGLSNGVHVSDIEGVNKSEFSKVISSTHEPLKDSELNKAERLALKAIRAGAEQLFRLGTWYDRQHGSDTFSRSVRTKTRPDWRGGTYEQSMPRRISVGTSDTAAGWTDGLNTIWIEKRQLRKIKEGMHGMMQLAGLLLHEYLHNGPDTGTHEHGVEFYERFHDISLDSSILTSCANEMMKVALKELRNDRAKVSLTLSRWEDGVVTMADAGLGTGMDDGAGVPDGFVPDVANDAPEETLPSADLAVAARAVELAEEPSAVAARAPRRRARAEDRDQMKLGI